MAVPQIPHATAWINSIPGAFGGCCTGELVWYVTVLVLTEYRETSEVYG